MPTTAKFVKYECRCPNKKCQWHGFWDDANHQVEWAPYGAAFGSPAYKDEHVYTCPCCGEELEGVT